MAWNGFNTEIGGVDNVNASRFLLGRNSAGLLRIPDVFVVPSVCQAGNAVRVLPRSHGLAVVTFAEVGAQGAACALITDQCKDRAHESNRRSR